MRTRWVGSIPALRGAGSSQACQCQRNLSLMSQLQFITGPTRQCHQLVKGAHRALSVACEVESTYRPAKEIHEWQL
jgi:hypothetical protein